MNDDYVFAEPEPAIAVCAACGERYRVIDNSGLCPTCPIECYVECCQCDQPATQFPDGYDEYCDACFAARFEQCASCNAWVSKDQIGTHESAPMTRSEPAEYKECCSRCRPDGESEPDPDVEEEW